MKSMEEIVISLYTKLNIPLNEPIEGIASTHIENEIEKRVGADPRTVDKYMKLLKKHKIITERKSDNGSPVSFYLRVQPTVLFNLTHKPLEIYNKKKGENDVGS